MTLEQFIKIAKDQDVRIGRGKPGRYNENDQADCLFDQVETGGVSGGSCWDSSNPRGYSTGKSLGRFSGLSTLVREVKPDISFLDYEAILDQVKTGEYTEYNYYGNETYYACQYIYLKDLYEALGLG